MRSAYRAAINLIACTAALQCAENTVSAQPDDTHFAAKTYADNVGLLECKKQGCATTMHLMKIPANKQIYDFDFMSINDNVFSTDLNDEDGAMFTFPIHQGGEGLRKCLRDEEGCPMLANMMSNHNLHFAYHAFGAIQAAQGPFWDIPKNYPFKLFDYTYWRALDSVGDCASCALLSSWTFYQDNVYPEVVNTTVTFKRDIITEFRLYSKKFLCERQALGPSCDSTDESLIIVTRLNGIPCGDWHIDGTAITSDDKITRNENAAFSRNPCYDGTLVADTSEDATGITTFTMNTTRIGGENGWGGSGSGSWDDSETIFSNKWIIARDCEKEIHKSDDEKNFARGGTERKTGDVCYDSSPAADTEYSADTRTELLFPEDAGQNEVISMANTNQIFCGSYCKSEGGEQFWYRPMLNPPVCECEVGIPDRPFFSFAAVIIGVMSAYWL
jgi:hypothetical protein